MVIGASVIFFTRTFSTAHFYFTIAQIAINFTLKCALRHAHGRRLSFAKFLTNPIYFSDEPQAIRGTRHGNKQQQDKYYENKHWKVKNIEYQHRWKGIGALWKIMLSVGYDYK